MELRQLEYFVAVVEERSFTKAAQRERVAQPAVSAQVRRLERQVGQPLLDRSSRDVRLTQAGAALLPHAKAALAAIRDAQAGCRRGDRSGSRIGGDRDRHASPVDIAWLMADFHADYPAVEITLATDNSDVLIDKLGDGGLDVAIVSIGGDEDPPGLDYAMITDEAIEAAVVRRHPLARRKTLPLAELCEHPLISLPVGTGLRSRLDAACAAAGLHPRIAFEATSPVQLAELARTVSGSRSCRSRWRAAARICIRCGSVPELRGRLVWAWRRDMTSPAARRFCERARRMIGAHQGSGGPPVGAGA